MAGKRGTEPDYGPLFVWGVVGITTIGFLGSIKLYERLRAERLAKNPPPPEPPPPAGGDKPTS
jgi:hypothetical protein